MSSQCSEEVVFISWNAACSNHSLSKFSVATGIPVPSCGRELYLFGSFCDSKVCDKMQKDAAHEMAFAYNIPTVFISGRVITRINHYVLVACEISKFVSQLYVV